VSIEPQDLADLEQVRDLLVGLGSLEEWDVEGRQIATEMAGLVEGVISGGDATGVLEVLNRGIQKLQTFVCATPAPVETAPDPSVPNTGFSTAMIDEDPALLAEFIAESLEHMQKAEEALLILEADPRNEEAINQVFRAFHTVKGTAGFVGLDGMQELSHKAESLLDRARKNEIRIVGGYADLALEACDMLKRMIQALETRKPGETVILPQGFGDLLAGLVNPDPPGRGAGDREQQFDALQPSNLPAAQGESTQGDECIPTSPPPVERQEEAPEKGDTPPPEPPSPQAQNQMFQEQTSESSVRVNTRRLDALMNMVGELVISHAMVAEGAQDIADNTSPLTRNLALSSKIVRELQDLTMALRMVPLGGTFRKMARLVRDLARKSGKTVQFHVEGEDTEIDRRMAEAINDPLMHMIRNAVDHGIESSEERARAGKQQRGALWLRAFHSAGSVVIEMEDDGRGLDRERIVAKAVERGVISPESVLSDAEVFGLIFRPGLSTAKAVTGVSGRGVGMDVVRKTVETLRGRIDVSSRPGESTTFTLRLPLTMAIIDAVVIRVGSERYLIPAVSIEESFKPLSGSVYTVAGRSEVVQLRESLIPLVRLHRLFGIRDALADPYDALLINVEVEGRRCALMADEVIGQQQVVIKPLGTNLDQLQGLAGAAILGDGRISLILDVVGLVKIADEGRGNPAGENRRTERQC
jgi:two-component system chemotaxis sensor kinase CheA